MRSYCDKACGVVGGLRLGCLGLGREVGGWADFSLSFRGAGWNGGAGSCWFVVGVLEVGGGGGEREREKEKGERLNQRTD